MGMDPKTLLLASIRPPTGQLDPIFEDDTFGGITLGGKVYDLVTYENTDLGIYPDEDYFCVYEYLTYGWGDTTELVVVEEKIKEFKDRLEAYCVSTNSTYKLHLTANFN